MERKIIDFGAMNGRMFYIRPKNNQPNMTIINVYASIEESNNSMIGLQTLIILVSFNTKFGKENFAEEVAGTYKI